MKVLYMAWFCIHMGAQVSGGNLVIEASTNHSKKCVTRFGLNNANRNLCQRIYYLYPLKLKNQSLFSTHSRSLDRFFQGFFVARVSFQKPIRLSKTLPLDIWRQKSIMVLVILYRRLTSSLLSWQVIGFFFCFNPSIDVRVFMGSSGATVRGWSQESRPFSRSYECCLECR